MLWAVHMQVSHLSDKCFSAASYNYDHTSVTNQKFFHILIGQRKKTKLLGIPYQTMQSQKQQQNPSATQPSTTSSSSVDQNNDLTALGLSPEFQEQATTIICRGNLPKAAVEELKKWLFQHFNYPYPNDSEKEKLMAQTGTVWTRPLPFSIFVKCLHT